MNYHFIELENDGRVFQQLAVAWDGEGPPAPPDPLPGNTIRFLPEPGDFARPSDDAFLVWPEDELAPVWTDPRTLAEAIAANIVKTDVAANAARARVLAQPTNTEEYHVAAAQAAAYRDAGFTGTVPESVDSWTYAKRRQGWTPQAAAEDILATAATWQGLLFFIRRQRLNAKELIRDATTKLEADLALETFIDNLTAAMQGVQ